MKNFKFDINEYYFYRRKQYNIIVECVRKTEYSAPFLPENNEGMRISIATTDDPAIAECIVNALSKHYA